MTQNRTVTATYRRPAGFIDTTNLIRNGTFTNTQNWTLNTWANSAGSFAASGGNGNITITTMPSGTGAADHSLQLIQNGFTLTQGLTYQLTFEASAAAARTMGVVVEMHDSPWTAYMASRTANLTSTMQPFNYTFTMTAATDDNSRLSFNVGNASQNVQIRNVRLVQVSPTLSINNKNTVGPTSARTPTLRATASSTGAVNVSFRASDNGMTRIKLYNLKGGLISSERIQTSSGTNYSHTFNPGNLSAGFYVVGMYSNGRVEQTRVVIPK